MSCFVSKCGKYQLCFYILTTLPEIHGPVPRWKSEKPIDTTLELVGRVRCLLISIQLLE